MWQKAVRVLLQVSILRIGLLFLTHIYQIYFQMIGYNGSVYIRQCFHCFPCTSNHFVSFVYSFYFYEGANYLIIFSLIHLSVILSLFPLKIKYFCPDVFYLHRLRS